MAKFPVDAPTRKVIKAFENWAFALFERVTILPCFGRIQTVHGHR